MDRRRWMLVAAALVVLIGGPALILMINNHRMARAYEEQLQLARAEGLATTGAEFAKLIPTATPEENAAPLYRKVRRLIASGPDVRALEQRLTFLPAPEVIDEATQLLVSRKAAPDLAEEATQLPKCWFDREWDLGVAVLMPEFADMRGLARLVALRGSVAAHRGDPKSALVDITRIRQIAAHARSETTSIARLVGESIDQVAMLSLAGWAHVHRDQPAYREALAQLIETLPEPDVKLENRGNLFEALSMIEVCSTPEGLKELGFKEEDLPGIEQRLPALLVHKGPARVRIVEAYRAERAALDLPPGQRHQALETASAKLWSAMSAFPAAYSVGYRMSEGLGATSYTESLNHRESYWESTKQRWRGLVRALEGPRPPAKIKVADLLSPFDAKPLSYSFDGKQMTFTVSGDSRSLDFPPDSVFEKPKK